MNKKTKILSIILCAAICITALAGCSNAGVSSAAGSQVNSQSESPKTTQDIWDTVMDAYIYTFPLVMMDATMTKMTNTVEAENSKAPYNQFIHSRNLVNASFKDVVTPNVDTLYTQVCLNLTDDALVFTKPKTDRFCSVQILNAYTDAAAILGTGGEEEDSTAEQKYLLTGPNYDGRYELDDSIKQVNCETNLGWVIIRTICYGEDDVQNVRDIQNSMGLIPAEYYFSGKEYVAPKGEYSEENNFIPAKHVLGLSIEEYFQKANKLMKENPQVVEDSEILNKLATVNVGADKTFDISILGDNIEEKWKELRGKFSKMEESITKEFSVTSNSWSYWNTPIGDFGKEYKYLALVALGGLGANPIKVALYAKAYNDNNGDELNGENKYVLHFEKDQLPPVQEKGFWSITAYNDDNFLIDNKINRYCINDRSNYVFNQDGSLDLYLQSDEPEGDKANNWLPIGDEEFHLYMRIYLPEDAAVNNQWETPTIKIVE